MAPDPAEEEFLHPAEGVVAEDGNLVGAHVTGTERAATRGSKPSAAQANEGPEYHAVPLGDPWEHHEQTTTSQKEQQHTQEHYAENEDVSGEGEGDEQGPDPVGGVQHKVDLEKGPSHAEEEDSGQVPAPGGGVQHEVDLEKGPPHAEEEDSEQVPVPGGGVQHEVDHENKPSSAEATKATEDQRKEEARANLEAAVDKLDVEKTVEVDYDTTGLTTAQVEVLRQKYGWNEVKPHQVSHPTSQSPSKRMGRWTRYRVSPKEKLEVLDVALVETFNQHFEGADFAHALQQDYGMIASVSLVPLPNIYYVSL